MTVSPSRTSQPKEITVTATETDRESLPSTRMWERAYMDVQRILDEALGTEEKDGAGEGIAGDVWLLASQRDEALRKLAAITAHCRRHTEWVASHRPDTLMEALVKADDIMTIINPPKEQDDEVSD